MLKLKYIIASTTIEATFSFEDIFLDNKNTGIRISVNIPQYILGKTSSPLLRIVGSRLARWFAKKSKKSK